MESLSNDVTDYNLPNELWFEIFDNLPPESHISLRAVSSLFRDLASEYYKKELRSDLGILSLKIIYPLEGPRTHSQALIRCLGPLRDRVRILFLENVNYIGGDWSFLLFRMSQISELILHESICKRGSSETTTSSFPNLEKLSGLTSLRKLEFLAPGGLTAESLSQLSKVSLTALRTLNFFGCRTLPGTAFKTFLENSALPSITNLTLYDLPLVKTDDLHGLSRLTTLTTLSLPGIRELGKNITSLISNLFNLKNLNISNCSNLCDQAILEVVNITSIKQLNLSGCLKLTPEGFSTLQLLTNLEELKLNHCKKVNDHVLKEFSSLTSLKELHLYRCYKVTDEGLSFLTPLSMLQTLYIGRLTQITELGLQTLQALPQLSDLFLGGCTQLTALSLDAVELIPSLKQVNFENCSDICQKDLNDFIRKNRGLNVLFSKDSPDIKDVQGDGKDA